MAVEAITDSNFEEKVLKSDKPVLVDFWAEWCGPCLMMGPVLEEIAKDLDGKVDVFKLNIEENPVNTRRYGITSIPNFGVFKNGELVQQLVGARPKKSLIDPISKFID